MVSRHEQLYSHAGPRDSQGLQSRCCRFPIKSLNMPDPGAQQTKISAGCASKGTLNPQEVPDMGREGTARLPRIGYFAAAPPIWCFLSSSLEAKYLQEATIRRRTLCERGRGRGVQRRPMMTATNNQNTPRLCSTHFALHAMMSAGLARMTSFVYSFRISGSASGTLIWARRGER